MNFIKYLSLSLTLSGCAVSSFDTPVTMTLSEPTEAAKEAWKKYQKSTGHNILPFVNAHVYPHTSGIKTVYYPFGGPDVIYPIYMYPNVEEVIITGLEPAGNPEVLKKYSSEAGFKSGYSLIKKSFFVTSEMQTELKESGVLYPLLSELELLGVRKVSVSNPDLHYPGFKISFDYNGIQRSISYYQVNYLDTENPHKFLGDLKAAYPSFGCLIKSSSYIPHDNHWGFTQIQDFIKKNAQVIVQDDTGIQLKYLQEEPFKLYPLGIYKQPYGSEFKGFVQPDLAEFTKENKVVVPFCFGYGCKRQPTYFMVAVRTSESELRK